MSDPTRRGAVPEAPPLWLAGRAHDGAGRMVVHDKFTGAVAAQVARADEALIDRAFAAAESARPALRRFPPYARKAVLAHLAARVEAASEALARALVIEVGKTIRDARAEVGRAIDVLTACAEEAVRIGGEVIPLEISPRAAGLHGIVRRVPAGVACLVTPFNFPLNLAAHKIGPAIAAGCPFVLKPAERTPITSLMLGTWLAETDLPPDAWSILPADRADAERFVRDPRPRVISFTGSPEVGWGIRAICGPKKVALELGGNAACIVDGDAELDRAVARLAAGAFGTSGQSCISVQRILVHASRLDELRARLVEAARALPVGDPMDEATRIGPLISEDAAVRVAAWIDEARAAGARTLCGGERRGALVEPALLEGVPHACAISCREAFGPVALLEPFVAIDDAIARANDSRYGLQAGIFTNRLDHAWRCADELEVGGVVVNDVPTVRGDVQPYGGVKLSGLGREGVRHTIEEMSELRTILLSRPAEVAP